jgi:hypothetical protein
VHADNNGISYEGAECLEMRGIGSMGEKKKLPKFQFESLEVDNM